MPIVPRFWRDRVSVVRRRHFLRQPVEDADFRSDMLAALLFRPMIFSLIVWLLGWLFVCRIAYCIVESLLDWGDIQLVDFGSWEVKFCGSLGTAEIDVWIKIE